MNGRQEESEQDQVKALLEAVAGSSTGSVGAAKSESALFDLVYGELRAIAGSLFKAERRDHTLEPTALVHEAYVKIVRGPAVSWESRAHFVAIAARAMRQILIDHARMKRAQKRGNDIVHLTLSGVGLNSDATPLDAIDVSEQLERLAALDERQGRVVEMRFFAGMTAKEIALLLGVSERTV